MGPLGLAKLASLGKAGGSLISCHRVSDIIHSPDKARRKFQREQHKSRYLSSN